MGTTTWLPVKGDPLDQIPAVADQLRSLVARLWDAGVDPVTLELCRLRVASLVGAPTDEAFRSPLAMSDGLVDALSDWPDHPRFSDARRAALDFAEQYVLDAHGVTDRQADQLREHFTPSQLATLTTAIAVFDALGRARAVLSAPK
jgi:alkylhydroperoxidase family enzyme